MLTQEILIAFAVVAVVVFILVINWIMFCVCIRNNVKKRRGMEKQWIVKRQAQCRFEEGLRALVAKEVNRRVRERAAVPDSRVVPKRENQVRY